MRERSAMLASVTFAFVLIAGLVLQSTLSADAEDCIAKPNAPAPQGEHWYYRIDHANNRQCWRLGPEGLRVQSEGPRVQKSAPQIEKQVAPAAAVQPPEPARPRRPETTGSSVAAAARAEAAPEPNPALSGLPSAVPRYAENARPSALRAACATAGARQTDANRQRARHGAGGGQFRVVKRQ